MALHVTEYKRLAREDHGGPGIAVQCGEEPALAEYTAVIGASSVQSQTFHDETRFVMVHNTAICHIAVGADPSASTQNRRLPADATVFYGIPKDRPFKLAVIQG